MLTLLAGAVVVAAFSPAQAAPKKPLPTAQQLLDRFVAVTGGKKVYASIKTMTLKGTVNMTAQGITGTFLIHTASPDKMYSEQAIPGVGTTKQGFDGKVGWSMDPINGVRVLEGEELESMKRSTASTVPSDWKRFFKRIETVGIKKLDGGDAYQVRMTPKVGQPDIAYYNVKTGILVRSDMVVDSPQGKMTVQSLMSDYRSVGGMKVPFMVRQKIVGLAEIDMMVKEAVPNPTIDEAIFARPKAPAAGN